MDQQQQEVEPIRVRIISIGDVSSGKSALIKRYCEPTRFVSRHIPTIGCDYGLKTTNKTMDDDGTPVDIKIDFFDLSGDAAYSEVGILVEDWVYCFAIWCVVLYCGLSR